MKYFHGHEDRKCEVTPYAKSRGTGVYSQTMFAWWWLRSRGYYVSSAAFVYYNGYIYDSGFSVLNTSASVRPAVWIKL